MSKYHDQLVNVEFKQIYKTSPHQFPYWNGFQRGIEKAFEIAEAADQEILQLQKEIESLKIWKSRWKRIAKLYRITFISVKTRLKWHTEVINGVSMKVSNRIETSNSLGLNDVDN